MVAAGQPSATGGPDAEHGLVIALRDLANAVRALQLYPATSPVVGEAVQRAHEKLSPYLGSGRLSFAVLPGSLRIGDADAAQGNPTVASLAERLHQRGVAQLHLDAALQGSSLQGLAEMLATDPDTLNEQGGVSTLCQRQQLDGIAVDMLQLDRLYADEEGVEADPDAAIWEQILGSFTDNLEIESIDWESLASDSEQLADFLGWLLDEDAPPPGVSEMSRVQLVRAVCERVGAAAAEIGPERVDAVAQVVSGFYDKLDKEVWIDLLGQSLDIGRGAGADAPPAAVVVDDEERRVRAAAGDLAVNELGQGIGASLNREQVEDLLVYALSSRKEASPRIFGLFHSLLEARNERDLMEQSIREAVRRQTRTDSERQSFEELWPRLTDALQGEQMDEYVSTTYRAQMEQLLTAAPLTSLWDLERIAPRLRELEPGYLVQRKAKVILEIVAKEEDDSTYTSLVEELERALPELIVDGQYIAAEEILRALATDLIPSRQRSDAQRTTARDVLIRFCNEHTLREVVRHLAGKQTTQIDAATRIFSSLGPMAVPALLEALSNERSRPIRVHLVRMLAAIGDQALPEIRKHLRDKRWFFVRNLVWIIGEIGDPRFVPHLGIIVNHPDVRVRREAVRSMAKLQDEVTGKVLLSAVDDSDEEVRLLAIRGLGTSASHAATPRLLELLRLPNRSGNNTEVIRAAAIALGRIGAGEALPELKRVARRPWLFRGRRVAAADAARWAIDTLQGLTTGAAPEARVPAPRRDSAGDADNDTSTAAGT